MKRYNTLPLIIAMMILVVIVSTIEGLLDHPMMYGISFFSGLLIIIFGLAIRWISKHQLGKYFSYEVSVREDHKVIDTGMFRYIRHPMYTGTGLLFMGYAVLMDSFAGIGCCFIFFAVGMHRIKVEEEAMMKKLGKKYRNYCSKTKKLIPFIW
ncbi:hypothetical protein COV93_06975 [Candidatus Woesearchaeota archaeon CG11_big_fil_rev_8_21_14_0_20_43_8]|nr:MAG: hypothetical protein COV93_06975 [Candidatus Woesearchaeota archaeon CG11_big_fil_rev_8_21_14_0_20_43_8]PIO05417.1 MAG: hypothetical protein COT47_04910 [Candidatus Woesearchaeota archaeon CG08_land_8_20_14_0_20_43_7]